MNNKSTIVRAILMDASECERPESEHPAAIEISAEDLQRILERHITAAQQATPFMWAIQEPGGGAYMDDGCVSSVRADVQAEVDGLNSGLDADDDPYQVVPVYLAAAPQAVQASVPTHELKAILADADIGPPVDTDGCCLECGNWTPWHHPEAHDHEDDCSAPRQYVQRRNWKARLSALIAATPAHPAEGVPAQAAVAVPDDVERARLIAKAAAKFHDDRTHLGNLVYVNDLVWALGILTAHPAEGVQPSAPKGNAVDWEQLAEDHRERAMFDRNLALYDGDPRAAIATSLRIWAETRGNGSFGLMCAVFANEVAKMHITPATLPAAQGIDAKELLTALDDLSFACFAGIGTKAPDVGTYNRTFAVLQKHRDAAQAKQGGAA